MPDNIYISASLIKDYLDCPLRVNYRLNHPDKSIQTQDMIAGNIVHSIIEKYWENREQAFLMKSIMEKEFILDRRIRDKIDRCIHNFFDSFYSLVGKDDLIEYKFKIPFGKDFLVGKMDRITPSGLIIDWKISSISGDIQLLFYQYVYSIIFGKQPTRLIKVGLSDSTSISFISNKILEYNLISLIIPGIISSIRNNTLPPNGLYTGKCYRCQYKESCYQDLGY